MSDDVLNAIKKREEARTPKKARPKRAKTAKATEAKTETKPES